MKKTLRMLLLKVLLMPFALLAQYVPNHTQGYQFMPLFNPAFSGIESFDDAKFSYRYQWAGFGDGAPKFVNLSFNKRIKQPLDLAYNSLRLSDFSHSGSDRIPALKRMVHAIGFNLFQSNIGVLKSIGGSFNYAVNYPISQNLRLAFGGSVLIENRKLDMSSVTVRDPDEFYNFLLRSSTSQTDLNIRAGAVIYSERFYFGLSYLPLINLALQSSELAMEDPFYRASIQTGYRFIISDELEIRPSLLALVQMQSTMRVDYSVKAYFQQKVWLGFTYRDIESAAVLLGFNINDRFTVSYSYEMAVGKFRTFEDGSHELILAARLRNLKRVQQYLW